MEKEYKFSADELESQIKTLSQKGITELYVCDNLISSDKKRILALLTKISEYAPEVFVSFLTKANIIDKELAAVATNVFCSFNIPFECSQKNGHILFDKKVYASKARVLNDFGVVFGFELLYAVDLGDNLKAFLERLDFAVAQYPNHLDFPQTQKTFSENCNNESSCELEPKTTGIFSAKEIRYARDVSFACKTFYTCCSTKVINYEFSDSFKRFNILNFDTFSDILFHYFIDYPCNISLFSCRIINQNSSWKTTFRNIMIKFSHDI